MCFRVNICKRLSLREITARCKIHDSAFTHVLEKHFFFYFWNLIVVLIFFLKFITALKKKATEKPIYDSDLRPSFHILWPVSIKYTVFERNHQKKKKNHNNVIFVEINFEVWHVSRRSDFVVWMTFVSVSSEQSISGYSRQCAHRPT